MLITLAILLSLAYAVLQLGYLSSWKKTKQFKHAKALSTHWTIVVATRDEASVISRLLSQILSIQLATEAKGRVNLILVDDHSRDSTVNVCQHFISQHPEAKVEFLQLPADKTGKKEALSLAISKAKGDWIVSIDADVSLPGISWLLSLEALVAHHVAIAGPVEFHPCESWFEKWQALDFCGMMAITAASIRQGNYAMGNGANLAFSKEAFYQIGGYSVPLEKQSASGDDMVLLGKLMQKFPGRIAFAKTRSAVVKTSPKKTLGAFVQQRLRWSAKTGLNHQASLTVVLGLVWIFHLSLFVGIGLVLAGIFPAWGIVFAWSVKLLVDYLLLRSATQFFRKEKLLDLSYPVKSIAHAGYVAGVGLLALLPIRFKWKGRMHRV